MNVVIALRGYESVSKLTHQCISALASCPEPKFLETMHKPVAGMDVFGSIVLSDAHKSVGVDYVLFVDDDIVFNPDDVVKLVALGLPLVGALYVTKSESPQPTSRFFDGQSVEFKTGAKPVEIQYLAGGFMLVKVSILQKVIASNSLPLCNSKEQNSFWPFFMPLYIPGKKVNFFRREYEYITEDYSFSERVRRAGFKVMLDPSIRLEHLGKQLFKLEHCFNGKTEQMESVVFTRGEA